MNTKNRVDERDDCKQRTHIDEDGNESTIVTSKLRSSFAPLSSRRIRSIRKTRSTRNKYGGRRYR